MKGTSTLHVTEATIIAAVQLYLDGQFVAGRSPVVQSVRPRNGVGNGEGYAVVVEERKTIATFSRDLGGTSLGAVVDINQLPRNLPDVPSGSGGADTAYNKRMVGGERSDG